MSAGPPITTPSPADRPPPAARRLVWLANALLLAYGLQALLVMAAPHPSATAALLAVSAQLSDQAFLGVLAVVLVQLGGSLDPEDQRLQQRCWRCRDARLLSSLLLCLVPLQLLLGWGEQQRLDQLMRRETTVMNLRLSQVRRAILSAPTLASLQADLARLQAPPLPAELLDRPLPELRRRLLSTLAVAEKRQATRSRLTAERNITAQQPLWQRLLQTCLLALIYGCSLAPEVISSLAWAFRRQLSRLGWASMTPRSPGSDLAQDYYRSIRPPERSEPP